MKCVKCAGELSHDEIGLTKKLVNRGTSDFFCFRCLSDHFKVPVEELKAMVERFRAAGCLLFLQSGKNCPETDETQKEIQK